MLHGNAGHAAPYKQSRRIRKVLWSKHLEADRRQAVTHGPVAGPRKFVRFIPSSKPRYLNVNCAYRLGQQERLMPFALNLQESLHDRQSQVASEFAAGDTL